jgi:tagatose 1,6-diphosphate aldolase
MTVSAGKLRGLRRLADKNGRFKMVAVDQRPPIINALRQKRIEPTYEDVSSIKATLTRDLAPLGSAILIDPDYGFCTAEPEIPHHCGLLLTLEDCNFDDTQEGRKTSLHPKWSVEKIKRAGADGVKLLLWYRPDCGANVMAHQKRLVRTVGEDCARFDIPFLLELLVYPLKGTADHTTDYIESPAKHPELVLRSLEDFAGAEYAVDIYKLESPVIADELPRSHGEDASEAQAWFNKIGDIIDRPWVMLSAGAGMEPFRRVLSFAYRAGAHGYLAGRAIWWEAFQAYPDRLAMAAVLAGSAHGYMHEINEMTDRMARAWFDCRHHDGKATLDMLGQNFPSQYGTMEFG